MGEQYSVARVETGQLLGMKTSAAPNQEACNRLWRASAAFGTCAASVGVAEWWLAGPAAPSAAPLGLSPRRRPSKATTASMNSEPSVPCS